MKGHPGFEMQWDKYVGIGYIYNIKTRRILILTEVCTIPVVVLLYQTDGPPVQTGNSGFVPCTSGSKIRTAGEDTHHIELQELIFSSNSDKTVPLTNNALRISMHKLRRGHPSHSYV